MYLSTYIGSALHTYLAFANINKKSCHRCSNTVYGKTFEWENFRGFHGFLADRESFPLESLAVYST